MPRFLIVLVMSALAVMVTACSVPHSQASRLTEEITELEFLLAEMPWVSEMRGVSPETSSDKIIYQFSFRTCPPCISFKQQVWPKLHAAGIETRLVMTARRKKSTADERTAVVQLARTRDWDIVQGWMKANSPKGYYKKMTFPAADGNKPREADLETLRSQIDMLDEILAVNGIDMAYPTVLWRDTKNIWHAEIGYHSGIADDIIASMGAE